MRLIINTLLISVLMSNYAFAHNTGEKHTEKAKPTSYKGHAEAKRFIDEMVAEGFDREYLTATLATATRKDSILKAISKPAERRLTWGDYRKIFLGQSRIDQGVQFWNEHTETIQRASEQFNVAPEIIVAIIGVETRYGRHAGKYRVLDALATLGFDYPPRSEFFRKQLKELFMLSKEEQLPIGELKGSYAGAMGYGQFIPSSYRHYSVDFDADNKRDILSNPIDAIGSVANYFAKHGWLKSQEITAKVSLNKPVSDDLTNISLKPVKTLSEWSELGVDIPKEWGGDLSQKATLMKMTMGDNVEYWLGLQNFYVITRYNHSRLYAMAVHQLSQEIKKVKVSKLNDNPAT